MSTRDDMMNRREFIRKLGGKLVSGGKDALGAYALFNLADNLPLLELLAQEMPASTPEAEMPEISFGTVDDFVVEGITGKWESLEDVLSKGSKEIPVVEKSDEVCDDAGCEIDKRLMPSLLYTFRIIKNARKKGECSIAYDSLESGSCIMLNQEGFFLTARHVIKDYVRYKDRLMLFYDPISGIIRRPVVVAYSKKADIALCRINAEGAEFGQNPVTKGSLKDDTLLYTVIYDPSRFASDEFIDKVFENFRISLKSCGLQYGNFGSYQAQEKEPLKVDYKDLGAGNVFSSFKRIKVVDKKGKLWSGDPFFACSDVAHGNSGTPLFSIHNKDIVGVLYQPVRDLVCESDDGHKTSVVACTNPANIRKLISTYIDSCKESE